MTRHAGRSIPPARPSSRRFSGRLGRRTALVLVGLVVLAVVALAAALWSVDHAVGRLDVDGLGRPPAASADEDRSSGTGGDDAQPADATDRDPARPLTVLLLGSDSREHLNAQERRELGTGDFPGERNEVTALVRLDPRDDELRVLNVPRDTLLTRCDGTRGRVNAAYPIGEDEGVGGATCVVATLQRFLGVTIDHVAKVDLAGFVDVVDALGGVRMHLEEPLRDRKAALDLEAGCQRLDGADALAFVRARAIDDDLGRIARQQRFLEELRRELAGVGVFTDASRLVRVATATATSLELDDTLSLRRIADLARRYGPVLRNDVEGRTVPGTPTTRNQAYLLEPDHERAHELVAWLLTGDDPAEEPGGDLEAAPGPSGTSAPAEDDGHDGQRHGAHARDADAGPSDGDESRPVASEVGTDTQRCR